MIRRAAESLLRLPLPECCSRPLTRATSSCRLARRRPGDDEVELPLQMSTFIGSLAATGSEPEASTSEVMSVDSSGAPDAAAIAARSSQPTSAVTLLADPCPRFTENSIVDCVTHGEQPVVPHTAKPRASTHDDFDVVAEVSAGRRNSTTAAAIAAAAKTATMSAAISQGFTHFEGAGFVGSIYTSTVGAMAAGDVTGGPL